MKKFTWANLWRSCGPSILGMLRRHREGRADFALYVWAFYNAVAWFDTWIDGGREARVA